MPSDGPDGLSSRCGTEELKLRRPGSRRGQRLWLTLPKGIAGGGLVGCAGLDTAPPGRANGLLAAGDAIRRSQTREHRYHSSQDL
jgi:hypothetical protein